MSFGRFVRSVYWTSRSDRLLVSPMARLGRSPAVTTQCRHICVSSGEKRGRFEKASAFTAKECPGSEPSETKLVRGKSEVGIAEFADRVTPYPE